MSMEGERVPIVFHPRFTTLTATSTSTAYTTTPMDMLGFNGISVELFRSKITGPATPTIAFQFEGSMDLDGWDDLGSPIDPSSGTNVAGNVLSTQQINYRYLRLRTTVTTTGDSSVTVFVVGYATRTTS